MGYALLWIEGLAVGLLFIAVATGCAARLEDWIIAGIRKGHSFPEIGGVCLNPQVTMTGP